MGIKTNRMLYNIYFTILYQPLFNLLVFFYNLIPDIGVAIILLTIVVKAILWPLSHKALKSQKALQNLQPKMEAIKEKYKDNKEKQGQEMMALYKREKINPFSSCLPLLIQLPFIIAVFRVFRNGLIDTDFSILYNFISSPGYINPIMFGILDLSKPQIFLGVLAGAAQFLHSRALLKRNKTLKVNDKKKGSSFPETMSKQMMYFMPVLTVIISASLPGGLALYWFIITLLNVVDQHFINKSMDTSTKGLDQNGEKPDAPVIPEVIKSK